MAATTGLRPRRGSRGGRTDSRGCQERRDPPLLPRRRLRRRAKTGRNYYTDFVKLTPADTIVLTLACGKYTLQRHRPRRSGRLPAHNGHGACNDAYSAIKVAVALAEAFGCTVNELPLSLVLFVVRAEGRLHPAHAAAPRHKEHTARPDAPGPSYRPNVLNFLVEHYNIAPVSTPEEDLKKILGRRAAQNYKRGRELRASALISCLRGNFARTSLRAARPRTNRRSPSRS